MTVQALFLVQRLKTLAQMVASNAVVDQATTATVPNVQEVSDGCSKEKAGDFVRKGVLFPHFSLFQELSVLGQISKKQFIK